MTSPAPNSPVAARTGAPVESGWICAERLWHDRRVAVWSAPELQPESLLDRSLRDFPAGRAVRVGSRRGELSLDLAWPLALDLHWLREATPGFPLGERPVRIDAGVTVRAHVKLSGEFQLAHWREEGGRTLLGIGDGGESGCEVQTECEIPAQGFDELLRGLTATTSIEWMRGVFGSSGSLRWKEIAERLGAHTQQLDDLAVFFRGLTTRQEHALWAAAESQESLASLRRWVEALAGPDASQAYADLLRNESGTAGRAFRHTVPARWLLGLSESALAPDAEPVVMGDLASAAAGVNSLLKRRELTRLLLALRQESDAEWGALAPWYRNRIAESCGGLAADAGAGDPLETVSPWLKRLRARLWKEAAAAARRMIQDGCPNWLGRAAEQSPLAVAAFAPGLQGEAALQRALHLDLQPWLESGSGACLIDGRIARAQRRGIRVEVILPFLDKRAWRQGREALAGAGVRQSPGGVNLLHPEGDSDQDPALHETAALVLGAAVTSRSERPADDMLHLRYENCRSVSSDCPGSLWRRLLSAYGVDVPPLPATPCEVSLNVQIPWRWAEAWCRMPLKRDADHLEKSFRLSLALQEMGRHWLPALILAEPACWDSPHAVWPVLVYAASPPFVDRRRIQYGWDPMLPYSMQRGAASALAQLPGLLGPIHESLRAAGRLAAAHYEPARAEHMVAYVQRHPRNFAALLAGDVFFLEHCYQIACMARELRGLARTNPAQGLRKLSRYAASVAKATQRGLKRLHAAPGHRGLGPLYLLEATRMLACEAPRHGLQVSLTLTDSTSVRKVPLAA